MCTLSNNKLLLNYYYISNDEFLTIITQLEITDTSFTSVPIINTDFDQSAACIKIIPYMFDNVQRYAWLMATKSIDDWDRTKSIYGQDRTKTSFANLKNLSRNMSRTALENSNAWIVTTTSLVTTPAMFNSNNYPNTQIQLNDAIIHLFSVSNPVVHKGVYYYIYNNSIYGIDLHNVGANIAQYSGMEITGRLIPYYIKTSDGVFVSTKNGIVLVPIDRMTAVEEIAEPVPEVEETGCCDGSCSCCSCCCQSNPSGRNFGFDFLNWFN